MNRRKRPRKGTEQARGGSPTQLAATHLYDDDNELGDLCNTHHENLREAQRYCDDLIAVTAGVGLSRLGRDVLLLEVRSLARALGQAAVALADADTPKRLLLRMTDVGDGDKQEARDLVTATVKAARLVLAWNEIQEAVTAAQLEEKGTPVKLL
jgi:hypothetical protein